jgi:predicted Zn-dependent protease with MMP-like domain
MRAIEPEGFEVDALEAVARFHLWQFEEALRLLDHHDALGEPTGLSLYYRSLSLEFLERTSEADAALTAAIARDPDGFAMPIRLGTDEVERLLRDVIASLPDDVRRALETVSVSVSPLPDRRTHAEGLDPLTLGVYVGNDLASRSHFDVDVSLDRIEIFQRNVERVAANREEAKHELRVTLLHEIGHHLGWDEDDLEERGLA